MKDTKIEKSRLAQFCDTIIMQAREALYDREDDILKAWHENIEEAQQNDKKFPPLKLGISATVDLEESKIETTLRFTAVYQSRIEAEIADPDQQELPGLGKALGKYVEAVIKDNDRKIQELAKDDSIPLGERMRTMMDLEEDVMIHDADEGPEIRDIDGWSDEVLEETITDLLATPTQERADFLAQVFADSTGLPFLKFLMADNRASAALKKLATKCAAAVESQPEVATDDY